MTPELTLLVLAALWQALTIGIYAHLARRQVGTRYALGARDEGRSLTGVPARAQRAMNNGFEALLLFAIAILVTVFADRGDAVSVLAGVVFLGARILYVPAYLLGLSPWRTVVWAAGFGATIVILGNTLI
ncbi:MAG: MAPEG family protein [Roseivivax sp.]|nr:MAPEG family protein [Roseivivax sp.]